MCTMPDGLGKLWADAVVKYESETDRNLDVQYLSANLRTSDDLLAAIENSNAKFVNFRNKHASLWTRLRKIMIPVSQLGSLASSGVEAAPFGSPASSVLGACLYLVRACEGTAQAYDWVEQIMKELEDFSEHLDQYDLALSDPIYRKHIIATFVLFLRVIARSETLIKRNRFKHFLRNAFIGSDDTTKSILDDFRKLTEREFMINAISTNRNTREIVSATQVIKEKQGQIQDNRLASSEDMKNLPDAFTVPAISETERMYDETKEMAVRDSGLWLQHEDVFQSLIQSRIPSLFVFGEPGAGKTYLMTQTTVFLEKYFANDGNKLDAKLICHYYFKETSAALQSLESMIQTFVWQVARQDRAFGKFAAAVLESQAILTSKKLWTGVFLKYFHYDRHLNQKSIIFVIDALDEAQENIRNDILRLVQEVEELNKSINDTPIQLLLFGRPDLRDSIEFSESSVVLFISREKNVIDLRKYISNRVDRFDILKKKRARPNGKAAVQKAKIPIVQKILEGADGVFLWAKLITDELQRKNEFEIQRTLNQPFGSVDDMIHQIFLRIERDSILGHNTLRKLFRWISFSRRDVSFLELYAAIGLPPQQNFEIDTEPCILEPDELLWTRIKGSLSSLLNLKEDHTYQRRLGIYHEDDSGDQNDEDDDDNAYSADEDVFEDDIAPAVQLSLANTHLTDDRFGVNYLEAIEDVPSHEAMATLAFSHIRIRNHLVAEGNATSRKHAALSVNFNAKRAQIEMSIDCLRLARMEFETRLHKYSAPSRERTYPMENLIYHLAAAATMERESLTDDDKRTIRRGLYWLFHSHSGSTAVYETFLGMAGHGTCGWFADQEILNLLRFWLSFTGLEDLDKDGLQWCDAASKSTQELFTQFAKSAAGFWLDTTWDSLADMKYYARHSFVAILIWAGLDETSDFHEHLHIIFSCGTYAALLRVTYTDIEYLAGVLVQEQNSRWHTAVGASVLFWAQDFTSTEAYRRATYHFEAALELGPGEDTTLTAAIEGLACTLKALREFDRAEIFVQRLQGIGKTQENDSELQFQLAELKLDIKDTEAATRYAREAYMKDKEATSRYLSILCRAGQVTEALELLRGMDIKNISGVNSLLEALDDSLILDLVIFVCEHASSEEFLKIALEKKGAELKHPKFVGSYWADEVLYLMLAFNNIYDQRSEALQLGELLFRKLLSGELVFDEGDTQRFLLHSATFSRILEEQAINSTDEVHREESLQRLTKLARDLHVLQFGALEEFDPFHRLAQAYPTIIRARVLREVMKVPKKEWQVLIAPLVEQMLCFLGDETTHNDYAAFKGLILALFIAGDSRNATGMCAVYSAAASKQNLFADAGDIDDVEDASDGPPLNFKLYYDLYCDGCSTPIPSCPVMYKCQTCTDEIDFCGECYEEFQRSRLYFKGYCNPRHKFYQTIPLQPEAIDAARSIVTRDGRLRRSWLAKMRSEWKSEDST